MHTCHVPLWESNTEQNMLGERETNVQRELYNVKEERDVLEEMRRIDKSANVTYVRGRVWYTINM